MTTLGHSIVKIDSKAIGDWQTDKQARTTQKINKPAACPAFHLTVQDNVKGCPNASINSFDNTFGGFSLLTECNLQDNSLGVCNVTVDSNSLFVAAAPGLAPFPSVTD